MDIQRRVVQGGRGLSGLMDMIPGYRGYKEKEVRRDADKLLRDRIAAGVADEVRRLNALKLELVNRGQIMALPDFERATTKLQRFGDQVRTASYGYAPLFSAISIDEAALQALYDYDLALEGGVQRLTEQRAALESALGSDGQAAQVQALAKLADDLNEQFSRRAQTILEGKPAPGPNPLSVLAPPEKQDPKAQQLINLRMGEAVSFEGTDYAIAGRTVLDTGGRPLVAYKLDGSKDETWLLTWDGGNRAAVVAPQAAPDASAGETLTQNDRSFSKVLAGGATASVEGPSGKQGGQRVQFQIYEAEAPEGTQTLWVVEWPDQTRAYGGKRIGSDEIELWTKTR